MRFQEKTAIITGAGSGMGLLCSKCWAKEGGNVVMSDISASALEQAVAEVNAIREGSALGVVCDVRDYNQVLAVRDRGVQAFGSIDLLVNFAGVFLNRVQRELNAHRPVQRTGATEM